MPTKRIKDISTTATSPATDDFFMVDGATEAVRKLPASFFTSRFAARSPDSGIYFNGKNASKGLASGISIGTSDFFVRVKFIVPTSNPSGTNGLFFFSSSSSSSLSSNAFSGFLTSTGAIWIYLYGASTGDILQFFVTPNIVTTYGGKIIDLVVVRNASTPSVTAYINGVSVAATEGVAGEAPTWAGSVTSTNFVIGERSGTNPHTGTITDAEYGNVALTAAEVLTLHQYGWAALPQYLLAGGAQADVIAGWDLTSGWLALSGGTIDDANSFTSASYGQGVYLNTPSWLFTGKEYLITYDLTSTGPSAQIIFGGSQVLATGLVGAVRVVADKTDSFRLRILGTGTVDINTLTVAAIGVAGSWDFSTGAGYQQRDLSGGKRPMTLSTTGVQRLREADILQVTATVVHGSAGNLQINGQAILPDREWRLQSAVAKSTTSISVDVGNASAGAQLVGTTALTAGTAKDLTIVAGAAVPTTTAVWSKASGAGSVTYALTYTRTNVI